jgi:hypothetical protein
VTPRSEGERSDELRFLEDQERRLLAIADELDSAGLDSAAGAVMKAADKIADRKLRASGQSQA